MQDQETVNLLNEIGMLAKTPRSGFAFLGSGKQSVAEHSYRTALIGLVLADRMPPPVDKLEVLLICLFHDLPEARTGDLNYVNKKYVKTDPKKALEDIKNGDRFSADIVKHIDEYEKGASLEAQIAHEADKLEILLLLKEEWDTGNPRAKVWMDGVIKRLKTEPGKQLAEAILKTPFDEWWLKSLRQN